MHIHRWAVVVGLLVGLSAVPVQAQEFRTGSYDIQGVPYHVFTRVGEPTVQVYVVGDAASGLYELGASTDLVRLFSFVGGPVPGKSQETRRTVNVRLYRLQEDGRELIYEASAMDLLADPNGAPSLRDGDVFSVEVIEKPRFNWRGVLQIITSVSALVLVGERLSRLF